MKCPLSLFLPWESRKTVRRAVGRLSWRERWHHWIVTPVTRWSPGMQRPEQTKFVWGCLQGSVGICLRGFIPLSSNRNGSLINTSAISRQQGWHAAYVSSVQNGAEREWAALASDVWALSHGAERAPRKAPDFQGRNLIPFLLLFL